MKHPGKTEAQRRVLDEIGCGNSSPMMAKSTMAKMLADGLIEELSPRIIGTGPFAVKVRQFQMPIPIYIEWCASVEDEPQIG